MTDTIERPVINFAAESAVGHTVTIKFGGGYEVPWDVVRGTVDEIRVQLADLLGVDRVSVQGVPLLDLIAAASVQAAAAYKFALANDGLIAGVNSPIAAVAATMTAAQPVETDTSTSASKPASKAASKPASTTAAKRASKTTSKAASKPASSAADAAFAAAAAETPATEDAPATAAPQDDPPFETDPILVALEDARTKEDLGVIWKANAVAFKNRPEVQAAFKAAAERIG